MSCQNNIKDYSLIKHKKKQSCKKYVFFIIIATTLFMMSCKSDNTNTVAHGNANPLLAVKFNTPYEVPPFEKIKSSDYLPAFKEGIKQQNKEINFIITNKEKPNFKNTIESLEKSGDLLNRTNLIFDNLTSANTSDELKKVAKQVAPLLTAHQDSIKLNSKLFKKIKYVYDNQAKENLTPEQKTVLKKYYDEFVRAGANLPETKKEELKKINPRLALLYLKFGDNVLAETNNFKLKNQVTYGR